MGILCNLKYNTENEPHVGYFRYIQDTYSTIGYSAIFSYSEKKMTRIGHFYEMLHVQVNKKTLQKHRPSKDYFSIDMNEWKGKNAYKSELS